MAPALERALARIEIGEPAPGQDLGLERAVEALLLALGLGMIGPALGDADAEPHQPHGEHGACPAAASASSLSWRRRISVMVLALGTAA